MTKLSIVIPCYNEEKTLRHCVEEVLKLHEGTLQLELIIVNDCSKDDSLKIAYQLEEEFPHIIRVKSHAVNQGKGAALHTGFKAATGHFVAIQDADLEYDPQDLKKLLIPLINNKADVVLGSRFLSTGSHRVLGFWHSKGNAFLTFMSNMFTDLALTDMETCYKVFKRDVIQSLELKEKRFGFEPEVVAKIAQKNLRIQEIGISYEGRGFDEGKKIGAKDGFRALYCIFKYNSHNLPWAMQFIFYVFIGGFSALVNLIAFTLLLNTFELSLNVATAIAFIIAAIVNYLLCISFLFKHKNAWSAPVEILAYALTISIMMVLDLLMTQFFITFMNPLFAKSWAILIGLGFNFIFRKFFVFGKR